MNDVSLDRTESEDLNELGPGQRLRAAREAKNMDRSEVAAKLHLGEDMVRALEEDDYSKLPDPVFIKGYLRKYARLVEEPEESLLASYTQVAPAGARKTRVAVSGIKQEVRSSHFLVRSISWLIMIGTLALVGVWLQGYFKEAPQTPLSVDEPFAASQELPETDELTPAVMTELPSAADELSTPSVSELEQLPEQLSALRREASDEIDSPLVEMPVIEAEGQAPEPAGGEMPEGQEAAPSLQQPLEPAATAETSPVAQEAVPAPEERTAPPLAEDAIVVFEFEEDCWVDLRDASGNYRILGNLSKGERRVLEGVPPYSVVLGNSQAVKIRVKGEPFDLGPYTRGNVARFRLDPAQLATP